MTQPDTLHTRLRDEINRRLAVARAAAEDSPPWHLNDWASRPYVAHIALHDPVDAIRRYQGELETLERHAIVWRDIGYPDEEREARYEEIPVCGRCIPKHSHFQSRADVPEGPCIETKALAHRLGVNVDG